jgi:hypothetical protein
LNDGSGKTIYPGTIDRGFTVNSNVSAEAQSLFKRSLNPDMTIISSLGVYQQNVVCISYVHIRTTFGARIEQSV